MVKPVTVTKILLIGKPMTKYEHDSVLAVFVLAAQLGFVMSVRVL